MWSVTAETDENQGRVRVWNMLEKKRETQAWQPRRLKAWRGKAATTGENSHRMSHMLTTHHEERIAHP